VGVRRGRREAVGDGPPERLGRLAGGGGGYRGGSRRTVGRHRRGGDGGIVARAGEPLGRERRLPERHLVLVGEIETLGLRRRHSIVVVGAAGSRNYRGGEMESLTNHKGSGRVQGCWIGFCLPPSLQFHSLISHSHQGRTD